MYRWRKLSPQQREEELQQRHLSKRPVHSLPHYDYGRCWYLITAACYEHVPHIGKSDERIKFFSRTLLDFFENQTLGVGAWVVLPNHYHVIVSVDDVLALLKSLGQLHGRKFFVWNGEGGARGRKVWCNAMERALLTDQHHFEALNYVHHNPVKHGYVEKWSDWQWSSASDYLLEIGREEAERRWREFSPPSHFGAGWDD